MLNYSNLRVLVTDDHTLFRRGTKMLLESFSEVGHVDEAENGQEALTKLDNDFYDLILLDLDMPIMDGWQASKKIMKEFPDLKVIMVSMYDSLEIISDLIDLGVHSYLLKNAEPEEVRKAITYVMNNDFYYNQLVSTALQKRMNDGSRNAIPSRSDLSPREIEVLQLISQELTMKEIAEKLFVSEQTIHTHRKNLMRKTKAKNAVGLVKFALQHGVAAF